MLFEYPISPANQSLLNKIQQAEIRGAQEASGSAIAELEAEIEKNAMLVDFP